LPFFEEFELELDDEFELELDDEFELELLDEFELELLADAPTRRSARSRRAASHTSSTVDQHRLRMT
jgi:hypothetical protein